MIFFLNSVDEGLNSLQPNPIQVYSEIFFIVYNGTYSSESGHRIVAMGLNPEPLSAGGMHVLPALMLQKMQ